MKVVDEKIGDRVGDVLPGRVFTLLEDAESKLWKRGDVFIRLRPGTRRNDNTMIAMFVSGDRTTYMTERHLYLRCQVREAELVLR